MLHSILYILAQCYVPDFLAVVQPCKTRTVLGRLSVQYLRFNQEDAAEKSVLFAATAAESNTPIQLSDTLLHALLWSLQKLQTATATNRRDHHPYQSKHGRGRRHRFEEIPQAKHLFLQRVLAYVWS